MESLEKREIMLDNYQNPANKSLPDADGYLTENTRNESCIDNIDLYVKEICGTIHDIKFMGEACAISTASASIMSKLLIGKTKQEALEIVSNFESMTQNKEFDANLLQEAVSFDEIHKQPSRVICANLPWNGIKRIIEKL